MHIIRVASFLSWDFGDVGSQYDYFFRECLLLAFFLEGKTLIGDGLDRLHPAFFGLRLLLLPRLLTAHILRKRLLVQPLQYLGEGLIQVLLRVEVDLQLPALVIEPKRDHSQGLDCEV